MKKIDRRLFKQAQKLCSLFPRYSNVKSQKLSYDSFCDASQRMYKAYNGYPPGVDPYIEAIDSLQWKMTAPCLDKGHYEQLKKAGAEEIIKKIVLDYQQKDIASDDGWSEYGYISISYSPGVNLPLWKTVEGIGATIKLEIVSAFSGGIYFKSSEYNYDNPGDIFYIVHRGRWHRNQDNFAKAGGEFIPCKTDEMFKINLRGKISYQTI